VYIYYPLSIFDYLFNNNKQTTKIMHDLLIINKKIKCFFMYLPYECQIFIFKIKMYKIKRDCFQYHT